MHGFYFTLRKRERNVLFAQAEIRAGRRAIITTRLLVYLTFCSVNCEHYPLWCSDIYLLLSSCLPRVYVCELREKR
jgi:hypothetical protein